MFQEFAEIILCEFEVFWSPLTNLIIEEKWDEETLPQILWDFSGGTNRTQTQLKSCLIKIFLCWKKVAKNDEHKTFSHSSPVNPSQ